jgi:lipopolysaccharide/colanic/teichoic acid biosynthesis glycosyltransferase
MSKKTAIILLLEFALFAIISGALTLWFGSNHVSLAFILLIFLFSWLLRYNRITVMFEHYTHILVVFWLCLVMGVFITSLTKDYYDFEVVVLSSTIWLLCASLIRYIIARIGLLQYVLLTHSAHKNKLVSSSKIRLISVDKLNPALLKSIDALVIDRKYNYDNEWRDLILHASVLGTPSINLSEYEEYMQKRLSLRELKQNWLHAGFHISPLYRMLKYTLELIFTLILAPFLLITYLVVSIIILISMGRPIFFTQYRVGMDNKNFKLYKFRSMKHVEGLNGETIDNDLRITKFGLFIRKFRIDELPQFINILKGEMSLIGPRPEWIETAVEFEHKIHLYRLRSLVKPGITGWAQVYQGHTIGEEGNYEKLQYDLYYVKHFSFIIDAKIVIKTIQTILTGFGSK